MNTPFITIIIIIITIITYSLDEKYLNSLQSLPIIFSLLHIYLTRLTLQE